MRFCAGATVKRISELLLLWQWKLLVQAWKLSVTNFLSKKKRLKLRGSKSNTCRPLVTCHEYFAMVLGFQYKNNLSVCSQTHFISSLPFNDILLLSPLATSHVKNCKTIPVTIDRVINSVGLSFHSTTICLCKQKQNISVAWRCRNFNSLAYFELRHVANCDRFDSGNTIMW